MEKKEEETKGKVRHYHFCLQGGRNLKRAKKASLENGHAKEECKDMREGKEEGRKAGRKAKRKAKE